MLKNILLAGLLAGVAWCWWDPAVEHGPGVLAPEDPIQSAAEPAESFEFRGYTVTPLANFSIVARVLGTERYHVDRESDLAPVDFALGWGPMSDSSVLKRLTFGQFKRWYYYRTDKWPIPKKQIIAHSANMHMIPSSSSIKRQLLNVVRGEIVSIEGQLVQVTASDGWSWKSSLSRKDGGANSCEVVFVRYIEVLEVDDAMMEAP